MADMTIIKDANGKELSVDMSKISDLTGDFIPDSSIQDSIRHKLSFEHNVGCVDADGNDIDMAKLALDIKNGNVKVAAIDVNAEATHSGKNHNYCIYYSDSMEDDSESFTNPFKKPLLKNHDSYSEPLGRIISAEHGDSSFTDERTAIHITARVTDDDAILKFIDGRYKTFSIGGSMNTVTCSICNKTILKNGKFNFCGHWRGETYKDRLCYWSARDIEYNELSVVNNPADDFAQITSIRVYTEDDIKKKPSQNNDNKEDNKMGDKTNDAKDSNELKNKLFDFIDNLLSEDDKPDNSTEDNKAEGNANADKTNDSDTSSDNSNENTSAENTDNAGNANDELEKAKADLTAANDKIAELEKSIVAKDEEIANLNKKIADSEAEANDSKVQMVEIAKQNKSLVSDAIIMNEISAGSLKKEDSENRKKELSDMSMKELGELLDKCNENSKQQQDSQRREPANVDNPTLATNDSRSNADKGDANKDQEKGRKTINDFASSIIDRLPV